MLYPYRFRTTKKDYYDVFDELKRSGAITIKNSNLTRSLGTKLQPIRRDINIAWDVRNRETVVKIPKTMKVEIRPVWKKRQGWDIILNKKF